MGQKGTWLVAELKMTPFEGYLANNSTRFGGSRVQEAKNRLGKRIMGMGIIETTISQPWRGSHLLIILNVLQCLLDGNASFPIVQ